jgi:hypothetical protein
MNIYNWYWLADDGRIFASASETQVASDDAAYVAWCNTYRATPWPRDDAGNQTDAALQDVLEPHGLFANLKYYTVNKRWKKEQGGITTTAGMPILTDDRSQAKINGTRIVAENNASLSTPWHAADGTFYTMASADIIAMSDDLQTHINNCFATSSDVQSQIDAGTITTRQQVDAAFDAAMTGARRDWLKKKK